MSVKTVVSASLDRSYSGSDSKNGNRQGGRLHLCQAEPTLEQPNLNKLGDGGGRKGNVKAGLSLERYKFRG